jgi:cytochrome bd-type quinol oxidase subunit 1
VSAPEILFSILLFGAIYVAIGALWLFLVGRVIATGPVQEPVPEPPELEPARPPLRPVEAR